MSDTVGFLLGFFSDEGFLHSMLVVCTTIITGIYVSAYLLGTGTLLFVFAYCAGHISLEVYVVQPIQYITQELVFAKGEVRHLLAMMVEDVPREDTGERVTLEEINGKQHVLYTVQKRFLWIMFWINVVGNLMQHFKDYVFVYFVALMPSLVGGEPPPTIEKLTQTTMSLAMMMGSLLGVTGMFEGWYGLRAERNRVADVLDALIVCRRPDVPAHRGEPTRADGGVRKDAAAML
jgi:hypothetical protein